ncbi:MAG: hypothetical protein KAU94_09275 [Verrucomicrobia bacterium]|nr:hypothetical protein [Verrucomicrobiota bacterium]
MQEWWTGLTGTVQFFYGMAAFFSVFFLWQMIGAFLGLDGDDMDMGGDVTDVPDDMDFEDVMESSEAFKVLSLRSIITFFTLFSWGGALYMSDGVPTAKAMGIASIWGLGGMFAIAGIFYFMGKMSETGTKDMATAKGKIATVYLDIPVNGFGEIKTTVSGAVEHIKAKSVNGEALPAGTQVRVVQVVGQTLVGVEKLTEKGEVE